MVGKSDFNENPVVSLDLDFGLRLRVCQKSYKEKVGKEIDSAQPKLCELLNPNFCGVKAYL